MPNELVSEPLTIDVNTECTNQEIKLTWLSTLGWEYWKFTAQKTFSYNIGNVETIERDVLQDWDTEFIQGQTQREHISIEAAGAVVVRSQDLTREQVEAIARIKYSIKVQDITDDPTNPVTVIVDKSNINYTTDGDKTNFIEFQITYPDFVIQQQ